jgi:type IV pilus assembly protein PilF
MRHSWLLVMLVVALAACSTTAPSRNQSGARSRVGAEPSPAEINVSLGQGYLEQGKLEIAMDKLQHALELDPKLPSAHTVIALIYERIGDRANAEIHYRRAVQLAPKSGATNNNYGTFLCSQGNYVEADTYFERALTVPFYETPAVAWANRGSCALKAGNTELAEQYLRTALQKDPNSAQALYDFASILADRKDFFRARAFAQRYEALAGDSPDSLLLGMRIEQGLGDSAASNEYRSRLLNGFPDSEQARTIERSESPR